MATTAHNRVRSYPRLHHRAHRDAKELGETVKELAQVRESRRHAGDLIRFMRRLVAELAFELTKARYDRGKLYIVLKFKEGPKLSEGDILVVVDMVDGFVMGRFTVTEERGDGYYAVSEPSVDPVWLGDIRQAGEVTVLPSMYAFLVRRGSSNDQ